MNVCFSDLVILPRHIVRVLYQNDFMDTYAVHTMSLRVTYMQEYDRRWSNGEKRWTVDSKEYYYGIIEDDKVPSLVAALFDLPE